MRFELVEPNVAEDYSDDPILKDILVVFEEGELLAGFSFRLFQICRELQPDFSDDGPIYVTRYRFAHIEHHPGEAAWLRCEQLIWELYNAHGGKQV